MNVKLYLVTDSSGRLKNLGEALLARVFNDGEVINVAEYPNHTDCKSFVIAGAPAKFANRLKLNGDTYLRRIPTTFNSKNIAIKDMVEAANKYVKSYTDCDVVFIPKEERLEMEAEERGCLSGDQSQPTKTSNIVKEPETVDTPVAEKIPYKKPEVITPPEPKVQDPQSSHIPYTPPQDVKIEGLNSYFVEALRYMVKYRYDLKEKDEDVFGLISNMILADKSKNTESMDYIEMAELKALCNLEAAKIIKSVIK